MTTHEGRITLKVPTTMHISNEFLAHAVVAAYDAADYWAETFDLFEVKDQFGNLHHAHFKLKDRDNESLVPHRVTNMTMAHGLTRIIGGEVDMDRVDKYLRSSIAKAVIEDDCLDSTEADVVVQAGLFGQIKHI